MQYKPTKLIVNVVKTQNNFCILFGSQIPFEVAKQRDYGIGPDRIIQHGKLLLLEEDKVTWVSTKNLLSTL